MKRLFLILLTLPVCAFSLSAKEIIAKVDNNQVYITMKYKATMIIKKGSKTLKKTFIGLGESGDSRFFMRYTNPEDNGVKYLKSGNELWIYFPDADAIMKISGHMLRQGMMGSDVSYEDLMQVDKLTKKYDASVIGNTNVNGVNAYLINLVAAKGQNPTYYKEVIAVDKRHFIPIVVEMYAKSGRLLKVMEQKKIKLFGRRYYPTRIIIRDMRRKNSSTTVNLSDLVFDVKLPSGTFSKRHLRR